MDFKELIEKALEIVDEAYDLTDYNTMEYYNLLEVKNLLNELI